MRNRFIRIEKPAILRHQEKKLSDEVLRYARLIPQEPEPNMGRVQEIKQEIKDGTYPTREMIDGAAARLMNRFLNE